MASLQQCEDLHGNDISLGWPHGRPPLWVTTLKSDHPHEWPPSWRPPSWVTYLLKDSQDLHRCLIPWESLPLPGTLTGTNCLTWDSLQLEPFIVCLNAGLLDKRVQSRVCQMLDSLDHRTLACQVLRHLCTQFPSKLKTNHSRKIWMYVD